MYMCIPLKKRWWLPTHVMSGKVAFSFLFFVVSKISPTLVVSDGFTGCISDESGVGFAMYSWLFLFLFL